MAVAVPVTPIPALAPSPLQVQRILPSFAMPPLAQAFAVTLPEGHAGLVWVSAEDALAVGSFGRAWVVGALTALAARADAGELLATMAAPAGLRLRPAAPAAGPAAPPRRGS